MTQYDPLTQEDAIDQEIPDAIQQAIGLQIVDDDDSYYPSADAVSTADGERWYIRPYSGSWTLIPPIGDKITAPAGQLQHAVVLAIAHIRQQREQQAAQAAESAALEQVIAVELHQARAQLWHWPGGRSVTIYRWTWSTGIASEYDVGAATDEAWSLQPALEYDGTAYGEIDRAPSPCPTCGMGDGGGWLHTADDRRIRLIPIAHLPTVEALELYSLADVPRELTGRRYHTIEGIRARRLI